MTEIDKNEQIAPDNVPNNTEDIPKKKKLSTKRKVFLMLAGISATIAACYLIAACYDYFYPPINDTPCFACGMG